MTQPTTNLHIIDFKWKYSNQKYQQVLELYDEVEKQTKNINLENYNFNFELSKERFCVGYSEKGKYIPCKFNNVITSKSYSQCSYCTKKHGFVASFFFNEEPNENIKEYLSQTHYIYLALFGHGVIKVGTAAESRRDVRLIEQDALAYCFIAKAQGMEIQKIEKYISKKFNVPEFIKSSTKFKNLNFDNKSNIEKELKDLAQRIVSNSSPKEFQDNFFDVKNIQVVDLRSFLFNPTTLPTQVEKELVLFGKFEGLRGKYLILSLDEDLFAFDTKQIEGRKIVGYTDNYRYNSIHQLSLLG